jgi:hypothetical protein
MYMWRQGGGGGDGGLLTGKHIGAIGRIVHAKRRTSWAVLAEVNPRRATAIWVCALRVPTAKRGRRNPYHLKYN